MTQPLVDRYLRGIPRMEVEAAADWVRTHEPPIEHGYTCGLTGLPRDMVRAIEASRLPSFVMLHYRVARWGALGRPSYFLQPLIVDELRRESSDCVEPAPWPFPERVVWVQAPGLAHHPKSGTPLAGMMLVDHEGETDYAALFWSPDQTPGCQCAVVPRSGPVVPLETDADPGALDLIRADVSRVIRLIAAHPEWIRPAYEAPAEKARGKKEQRRRERLRSSLLKSFIVDKPSTERVNEFETAAR